MRLPTKTSVPIAILFLFLKGAAILFTVFLFCLSSKSQIWCLFIEIKKTFLYCHTIGPSSSVFFLIFFCNSCPHFQKRVFSSSTWICMQKICCTTQVQWSGWEWLIQNNAMSFMVNTAKLQVNVHLYYSSIFCVHIEILGTFSPLLNEWMNRQTSRNQFCRQICLMGMGQVNWFVSNILHEGTWNKMGAIKSKKRD